MRSRTRQRCSGRVHGFTVVELMVTVAVLAIVLAIGVPSYFNIIRNNRLASATSNLLASLNFARSEAIKRGDPVTVCPTSDGEQCTGESAWVDEDVRWMAFLDRAGTSGVVDAGVNQDEILQFWPALEGGLTMDANNIWIQYLPNGMSTSDSGAPTTLLLFKPGCTGDYARRITVTLTGRVASEVTACPST